MKAQSMPNVACRIPNAKNWFLIFTNYFMPDFFFPVFFLAAYIKTSAIDHFKVVYI